ncbi:PQ-loop domain-containing transporter [bacterium]|jgi:MtN3 and saliva related transmembrane protein|nr:PQ-loop domain-containing transporter [Euryarchaeota archaeon]MDC3258530.1 PQ-loop domain-containing transporter [bacterium]MDC3310362.1 PQ-loop domain-containing transporter [Candidatus Poseidoniales archaeon]
MVGLFIESIGIIAGTLGVLAWIPQLKEVWIMEKHEGISLSTLHLISTALLLWLIYGLMIMSIAIIISNLAALACILSVIIGVIRLREVEKDSQ